MAIQTSAGSKIFLSSALPATFDLTGYQALTFTEIKSVESIGPFGSEDSLVTFNALADRTTRKFKGSRSLGSIALTAAIDTADAGQDLLRTASDSLNPISFKVERPTGDIVYFLGLVMTNTIEINGTDTVTMTSATIEVTPSSGGVGFVYSDAA